MIILFSSGLFLRANIFSTASSFVASQPMPQMVSVGYKINPPACKTRTHSSASCINDLLIGLFFIQADQFHVFHKCIKGIHFGNCKSCEPIKESSSQYISVKKSPCRTNDKLDIVFSFALFKHAFCRERTK